MLWFSLFLIRYFISHFIVVPIRASSLYQKCYSEDFEIAPPFGILVAKPDICRHFLVHSYFHGIFIKGAVTAVTMKRSPFVILPSAQNQKYRNKWDLTTKTFPRASTEDQSIRSMAPQPKHRFQITSLDHLGEIAEDPQ
jgi:hypothetical protein